MKKRFSLVVNHLASALWAGAKSVIAISTKAIALLSLLVPAVTQAMVAPGTVVTNTAYITFQHGLSGSPITLASNTDEFTVETLLPANTAEISVTGHETRHMYPGSSVTLDIDISNAGSNNLADGYVYIETPNNAQVVLTGKEVKRVNQATRAASSTQIFSMAELGLGSAETLQLSITLPLDVNVDDNKVNVKYRANGIDLINQSVTLDISPRTEAQLKLMHYSSDADATTLQISPAQYMDGDGVFHTMSVPELNEAPGTMAEGTLPLKESKKFSHNQVIFISLADGDQNLSTVEAETIDINFAINDEGESEHLRLTETGPDTGIFTGFITMQIRGVSQHDGTLEVHTDTEVNIDYTDRIDQSDARLELVLVDPYGVVFDSATGEKLSGYTVHLVHADTGLPATVYGDDGISSYPSTLVTGGSVTDGSGHVYEFSKGAFRFPFTPVGNYKLIVVPPEGSLYYWPSTQPTELMEHLPDAPFAVILGSRGEEFPLLAGPPLHIDIPVDRLETPIYIQRTANKEKAAAGDFVQYRVEIENVANIGIDNVVLTDTLPHGFRLEQKSLRIDDTAMDTASLSNNGDELIFNLGNMDSEQRHTIEYVAAVGAVQTGNKRSVSTAIANGGAARSNEADHDIEIFDELMRDRAMLMGQVMIDPAADQGTDEPLDAEGLAGARVYMEDGRYAITDERGMYHFENVVPGSHVVQLDLDTIPEKYEAVLNENNTRFAGRAWSQFVDVQGGTLWRTDFHLALKPRPIGSAQLQISNETNMAKGEIVYHVDLGANTIDLNNLRLTIMMPEGAKYLPGSSRMDGNAIQEPQAASNMLIYRLGDFNGDWHKRISYTITDAINDNANELVTKASVIFNTPHQNNQRMPLATHTLMLVKQEKKAEVVLEEFIINPHFTAGSAQMRKSDIKAIKRFAKRLAGRRDLHIHTIGHTDNIALGTDKNDPFQANMTVSEARARIVANLLRDQLNLTPDRVTIEGKGQTEPLGDNNTKPGRELNNRVHVLIYQQPETEVEVKPANNDVQGETQTMTTKGLRPGSESDDAQQAPESETTVFDYDASWLKEKDSSFEWLIPADNELAKVTSTDILVKHHKDQRIEARVNGEPVDVNFDGTIANKRDAKLSRWTGIDLHIGYNTVELNILNDKGDVTEQLSRQVYVAGAAVNAELIADKSQLKANGRDKPVIALRLTDEKGQPLRPDSRGQFRVEAPYAVAREGLDTRAMKGVNDSYYDTYTVGKDGIALIELEPTTQAGEVKLELLMANGEKKEYQAKLKAELRDWVIVGLAEGTAAHNQLAGHVEPLSGNAAEDGLYSDGKLSLFAKGQLSGQWLMTVAYDTSKRKQANGDPNIGQTIDPGTYYTVYGDDAHSGLEAMSSQKLYLKLERDEFYFLFGDYNTDLTDTELAVYSRTLTGIKSRYEDETYDLILFASESNQSYVKEEFRGEGRSGPYKLSRKHIAMNTDQVTLEIRDRFHSENILDTIELSRHTDYDIDYVAGTITFRKPVFSIDKNLDHIFIVIKYEAYDEGDKELTAGGRAKVQVNDKVAVGVTHVQEGRTGGHATLDGVDAAIKLTDNTNLRLEAAQTEDDKATGQTGNGKAYLAELEHQNARSTSKAYVRENEDGFGLGQTNGSETASRKIGAETNIKATDKLQVTGEVYRQENTSTETKRDVAEAQGEWRLDIADLRLGLRSAEDTRGDGSSQKSEQITTGATKSFFDNRITAHVDREENISSGNSVDFPTRTELGVDYRITGNASLFIEQERTQGQHRDTRNTLIGVKATPWTGGNIYSGLSLSQTGDTETTSADFAGDHSWKINDRWAMNFGAEESRTLNSSTSALNTNVPMASADGNDFTAGSVGVNYTPGDWMWTARLENRNGTLEDSLNFATSVQTVHSPSLSTLANLDLYQRNGAGSQEDKSTDITLGLAYRPSKGSWIVLDKLDLKWDDSKGGEFESDSWRAINLLHGNYKRDAWQLSLQYGTKTVKENIANQNFQSLVDLIGAETRYDINSKWDVGVHANVLNSRSLNHYDFNSGISIGRSVGQNIWISLGYNFEGFRDEDFSATDYTSKGVFMKFRLKFDQQSVKEGLKWLKN